jgi:hypothetical protein
VDARLIGEAQAAGLAVRLWAVNEPEDLQATVDCGVDAVITDRIVDAVAAACGLAVAGGLVDLVVRVGHGAAICCPMPRRPTVEWRRGGPVVNNA